MTLCQMSVRCSRSPLMLKRVVITNLIRSYNMWLKAIHDYEHYSLFYSSKSELFIGIYVAVNTVH